MHLRLREIVTERGDEIVAVGGQAVTWVKMAALEIAPVRYG